MNQQNKIKSSHRPGYNFDFNPLMTKAPPHSKQGIDL